MKKLLTLLFLAAFSLSAQNLIFNGELELGTDGYACRTILRPDTNPELVYTPLETAGKKGAKFLLVRSPFAERFELYLKEFPLKPDTDYTLRFKAKCSVAGQPLRINISRVSLRNGKLDWNGFAKTFTLGTEWQNIEFKFNSARRTDGFAHLFLTGQDQKENPVADFSFDSFELFETKSTPYNSVQIAVSAPDYLVVTESAAPIAVTAKAANFTPKTFEGSMTVSAMDDTTEKKCFPDRSPHQACAGRNPRISHGDSAEIRLLHAQRRPPRHSGKRGSPRKRRSSRKVHSVQTQLRQGFLHQSERRTRLQRISEIQNRRLSHLQRARRTAPGASRKDGMPDAPRT